MTIVIGRSVVTRYPLRLLRRTHPNSSTLHHDVKLGNTSSTGTTIVRKCSSFRQIEKEVRTTLEVAVPTLLEQKKDAQLIPPWWGVVGSLSSHSSSSSSSSPFVSINDKSIDDLATLNGYHRVPFESHHHNVPLASGVLAQATEKIEEHYAVFVRQHSSIITTNNNTTKKNNHDSIRNEMKQRFGKHYEEFARRRHSPPSKIIMKHCQDSSITTTPLPQNPPQEHHHHPRTTKQYPPLVKEDYNVYRVLENWIEQYLNQQEERLRTWFQGNIEQTKVSYHQTVNRVSKPLSKWVNSISTTKSPVRLVDDDDDDATTTTTTTRKAGKDHDKLPTTTTTSSSSSSSSLALVEEDEDPSISSGNEDLLIVAQDGQVLLYDDVPTPFRILVLPKMPEKEPPYRMKHGRAGTVIYSSLVFFGAVPAAYRSLKYALDYPGLAQVMVASVVGSISYSFWASRESAKSSQSMTVTRGTAARLLARDDAALSLLRDGATKVLVEDVMDEYLGRLKEKQHNKEHPNNKEDEDEDENDKRERTKEIETKQLHPLDIAIELGLLERAGVDGESKDELVAIDWSNARSRILHRATKSMLTQ